MFSFDKWQALVTRASALLAITGAMGLLFATLVTCISILLKLLRRTLDRFLGSTFDPQYWSGVRPILGEEELVQYGVGLALFAALPWVMLNKGHIRVDLLKPLFSGRLNHLLDLLADIALTVIAYLILTRQWSLIFTKTRRGQSSLPELFFKGDFAAIADRLRSSQESQILGIPLWPLHSIAEFCVLMFFLAGVFCVCRSLRNLYQATVPVNAHNDVRR